MRAAMSLTSKDYHASPMRQILIVAKNTGKERRPQLPTYRDRAMSVLYGYSLIPVTEALAERKSFAFRPGRSAQDAHAYVFEALKGKDAPSLVVCGDIKAYYSHIQHAWLFRARSDGQTYPARVAQCRHRFCRGTFSHRREPEYQRAGTCRHTWVILFWMGSRRPSSSRPRHEGPHGLRQWQYDPLCR